MESIRDKRLLVLGYHKVGPPDRDGWETWYYVSESLFERHLTQLRETGWHVLDLPSFLNGLRDPDSLPDRAALITFDDGYRNNLRFAAPLLKRFGFPGILFVPTHYVGGTNAFDEDVEPVEPICTWDELAELESLGVSVQSHGVTHRTFSSLTTGEVMDELVRSKEFIEMHLKGSVETISFPYGDEGADAESTEASLRTAGYRAAFLYGGGINVMPLRSPYRLHRIAIGSDTELVPLIDSV